MFIDIVSCDHFLPSVISGKTMIVHT